MTITATTPEPTTDPVTPTTTEPDATTESAPRPDYGTAPTTAVPADHGTDYSVTGVKAGAHEGFDRVVVELTGGEAANLYWWAEYDPQPLTQGKGDPVELPGAAVLRVNVQGIAMPEPGDDFVRGLQPNTAHGAVTGVYVDPMFESMIQVFIGLNEQAGFHISTLDSPTRIVIDIENTG